MDLCILSFYPTIWKSFLINSNNLKITIFVTKFLSFFEVISKLISIFFIEVELIYNVSRVQHSDSLIHAQIHIYMYACVYTHTHI